jgi:hypothetical protein
VLLFLQQLEVIPSAFVPLEFSTDAAVVNTDKLDHLLEFLRQFAATLKSTSSEGFLGLCVVPREFYSLRRPMSPTILVEKTDRSRRANVMRFARPSEYPTEKLIETTWIVKRESASLNTSSHCSTYCAASCVPISACLKDDDGQHSPVNHHDGSHTPLHGEK